MFESDSDPFAMTADPAAYVRREATERALGELTRAVLSSSAPVALTGPGGLGKTLLLRLLARELEGRVGCVCLPYPALPPEGLCAWALAELGLEPGANPEARLLEVARRAGRPLLLLVDEAGLLPVPSARGLLDLCAESRGALRLLVAAGDGSGTGAVLASLGSELREVRLRAAMNESETAGYLRHRLALCRAPAATRARFDDRALARLHRESGGVPRLLHQLATELLLTDSDVRHAAPEPEPLEVDELPLAGEEAPVEVDAGAEAFLGPADLLDADGWDHHLVDRTTRRRPRPAPAAPPAPLQLALAVLVVGFLALTLPLLASWLSRP